MKLPRLLLLSLTAALAFAQQPTQDENSTQWSPVTLAGEFLEHDFVNWFAFADGVYDSYAPISTSTGKITNSGSFGWELGAGVSAVHAIQNGSFSISYRGDYRDYQNAFYNTGTDQSLSLSLVKRLTRRWTASASVNGGIYLYGASILSSTPSTTDIVTNSPFSSETKYLSAGATLAYQQSRRLSYVLGGSYFLQRYNFPGAVGAEGISASASAYYRTTIRTTIGATYSHSYFTFQRGAGTENGDTVQGSVSHVFPNHWNASVSGGFTRSSISGTSIFAASLLFPNANLGPGLYVAERFNETTSFPSFSGTVGRNFRHSNFYATAGQGLSAGNGYYLASKTLYLSGLYSIAINKRQTVSVSGNYSRLSSVSNTVSEQYSSDTLTVGYGVNLVRYFGLNARYDYVHYGNLAPNPSVNDNRLSFGVNFSSKSIPLTIF